VFAFGTLFLLFLALVILPSILSSAVVIGFSPHSRSTIR
jgi:hypothetical protein